MLTQSTIKTIREALTLRRAEIMSQSVQWMTDYRHEESVLRIDAALAELQTDAGGVAGGLPMPDGPGWWGFKGKHVTVGSREIEFVRQLEEWQINAAYVTYRWVDQRYPHHTKVEWFIEEFDGAFYRLYMPWEQAQPAPVVAVPAPDWLQAFPPEWDRHPWANYAYLQPSYSHFDGITFMWYYFECEPEWGEKSYNWVAGKHGYQNPVTRAPLSTFFDVHQTLQARPQPPQEQDAR